jgi:glycosyltransferase involved in cell wall biosynthesis
MARTRVLYVQSTAETGGSDISLLRIIETLDKSRYEPFLVVPARPPASERFAAAGCHVVIEPAMLKLTTRRGYLYYLRYLLNYPFAVLRLARLVRRLRIDVVHTNTIHNLYGFAAAAVTGRPHVWHIREIVLQSAWVRAIELFLVRRFADFAIVTSDAVASMFLRGGRYPRSMRKIANGVDVEVFHPSSEAGRLHADLALPEGAPLLALVGRMDHWKGVDTFIAAAAKCAAAVPQAQFVVVGGAVEGREEYAAEMKKLAADLGLEERMHFTGWRYQQAEMPAVYRSVDAVVLASSWPEPFGLVVLEAMAMGKPVIATNHGGPAEICVNGETAILVPPRDPDALAAAMIDLLRDPARARRLGAAGRLRCETLYDQRRTVAAIEALYAELGLRNRIPAEVAAPESS